MILEEVPDAFERPGGCTIQVYEADDRSAVTILIPPRPLPWALKLAVAVLALNLLVTLYTGLVLFVGHRSVLLMAQIAPHDLPLPLHRWRVWLVMGWLALEALGVLALLAMVRPALMREIIHIDPDGVSSLHQLLGRRRGGHLGRPDVRGFHLARDPQRLVASTLSVRGHEQALVVAEYATEADREWLLSVGNVLLRRFRTIPPPTR